MLAVTALLIASVLAICIVNGSAMRFTMGAFELQIDGIASVAPRYVGPEMPAQPEGESIDFWGMRRRLTAHEGGAYNEQIHWPLAAARSVDDLDAYIWPQTDWFDYSHMRAEA